MLLDKVTIVTGAASGIGEATALLFAAHGSRAGAIADIQDEKGRAVAELIGSGRCSYFRCDVSDEEQVKALVDWTAGTYGGLDIIFSNAAVTTGPTQSILEIDLAVLDEVMKVNNRGMAACVKHAGRKMVELGTRGAIVCTASTVADVGAPTNVDYAMSKSAVVGLMKSAFLTLGEHGIRINCVSPSLVLTPLSATMGFGNAEVMKKILEPLTCLKGVSLTAARVAEAVVFLAFEAAAFVTGHNLVLDGGLSMHGIGTLIKP